PEGPDRRHHARGRPGGELLRGQPRREVRGHRPPGGDGLRGRDLRRGHGLARPRRAPVGPRQGPQVGVGQGHPAGDRSGGPRRAPERHRDGGGTQMKILWLSAVLLAAAPAATVPLTDSGSARVGTAAPSFGGWDLTGRKVLTLDGVRRTPTMASLLITFGASFCKPCNEGVPRMVALTKKHPELRLVLIDVEPDTQKAQEFAQ